MTESEWRDLCRARAEASPRPWWLDAAPVGAQPGGWAVIGGDGDHLLSPGDIGVREWADALVMAAAPALFDEVRRLRAALTAAAEEERRLRAALTEIADAAPQPLEYRQSSTAAGWFYADGTPVADGLRAEVVAYHTGIGEMARIAQRALGRPDGVEEGGRDD